MCEGQVYAVFPDLLYPQIQVKNLLFLSCVHPSRASIGVRSLHGYLHKLIFLLFINSGITKLVNLEVPQTHLNMQFT